MSIKGPGVWRGGEIELVEKLGRNPGSSPGRKRFQEMLHALGPVSTAASGRIIGGERGVADLMISAGLARNYDAKKRQGRC